MHFEVCQLSEEFSVLLLVQKVNNMSIVQLLKRVSPVNDFLFVHLADRFHDVSAEALVKGQHGGGVPQHFDHRVEALRPRGRKRSGKECTVHRKDEVT